MMMEAFTATIGSRRFVIKNDPAVGYYLYVFAGEPEKCIEDHLQESLELAKSQALEEYAVPLDAWVKV